MSANFHFVSDFVSCSIFNYCVQCVFLYDSGGDGRLGEEGVGKLYCSCQFFSKSFMIISLCLSIRNFFTLNVSNLVIKQRANRRGPAVVVNKDDFTSCVQVIHLILKGLLLLQLSCLVILGLLFFNKRYNSGFFCLIGQRMWTLLLPQFSSCYPKIPLVL